MRFASTFASTLVFAAAASHCCGSVRSQGTMIASAPMVLTVSATGSMAAQSRPTSASRAPSAAKASVMAAPIPFAGPLIIATGNTRQSRDLCRILALEELAVVFADPQGQRES